MNRKEINQKEVMKDVARDIKATMVTVIIAKIVLAIIASVGFALLNAWRDKNETL